MEKLLMRIEIMILFLTFLTFDNNLIIEPQSSLLKKRQEPLCQRTQ